MAKLHVALASVDPRVRVRRTSSTRLSISFRGGQGEATELPSDLVFFKHEPTWREVYYSAVSAGIESCDVEVATSDDFGLNAKSAGEIVRLGFNCAGSYANHVKVRS